MPKELRMSATIEVPDDVWGQTDALAALKDPVSLFTVAVEKAGGTLTVELVTPKPRGEKPDAAAQYTALGGKLAA